MMATPDGLQTDASEVGAGNSIRSGRGVAARGLGIHAGLIATMTSLDVVMESRQRARLAQVAAI